MIACGEKQDHLYLEKDNNLVWNFEDIFCLHVPSNLCCGLQLTSYAQKLSTNFGGVSTNAYLILM